MAFTLHNSDAYLDLLLHVAGVIGAIVVGGQALHHLRGALGTQAWPGADVAGDQAQASGWHRLLHHPGPVKHHWTVAGEPSIEIMARSLK